MKTCDNAWSFKTNKATLGIVPIILIALVITFVLAFVDIKQRPKANVMPVAEVAQLAHIQDLERKIQNLDQRIIQKEKQILQLQADIRLVMETVRGASADKPDLNRVLTRPVNSDTLVQSQPQKLH